MKKTIMTTAIMTIATSTFAGANKPMMSKDAPMMHVEYVVQSPVNPQQDLMARCYSFVQDLARAQRTSVLVAQQSGAMAGAKILIDAIKLKNAYLPPVNFDTAYPNTIDAIRGAAELAKVIEQTTRNVNPVLKGKIQFHYLTEMFKLIKNTYEMLDQPHFARAVSVCGWSGCTNAYESLDNSYYTATQKLAQSFLNLQTMNASGLGLDIVELKTSRVIVSTVKNLLANSMYRRNFACLVTELSNINFEISQHLAQPILSDAQAVEMTRASLSAIQIPTSTCGYY
jgi:hypothetical protein